MYPRKAQERVHRCSFSVGEHHDAIDAGSGDRTIEESERSIIKQSAQDLRDRSSSDGEEHVLSWKGCNMRSKVCIRQNMSEIHAEAR